MIIPKIKRRSRDGVFFIEWRNDGKRSRQTLGTTDAIEAGIWFSKRTGLPAPTVALSQIPMVESTNPSKSYKDAVNAFILHKYGIKNA